MSRAQFERDVLAALPRVRPYVVRLCKDLDMADDLMQDVVEKAIRGRHTFRPGTNLGAWLYTIAKNRFLVLRVKYSPLVDDPDGDYTKRLIAPDDPHAVLAFRQTLDRIERMSPSFRDAATLIGILGYGSKEASVLTGVGHATLKTRMWRVRELLHRYAA